MSAEHDVPDPFELAEMFKEDRPTMAEHNKDSGEIYDMVIQEVLEFQEAWIHYDENPTEPNLNHVMKEACDVILFLAQMATNQGRDIREELRNAIGMNIAQYPAKHFLNGLSYYEARFKSKLEAKEMNLKEVFYGGQTIDGGNGVIYDANSNKNGNVGTR